MNTLKFIVFIELIAMLVTGIMHIVAFILKQNFDIVIYPIIFGIVLSCILLAKYVIAPFGEWFLS